MTSACVRSARKQWLRSTADCERSRQLVLYRSWYIHDGRTNSAIRNSNFLLDGYLFAASCETPWTKYAMACFICRWLGNFERRRCWKSQRRDWRGLKRRMLNYQKKEKPQEKNDLYIPVLVSWSGRGGQAGWEHLENWKDIFPIPSIIWSEIDRQRAKVDSGWCFFFRKL